MKNDNYLADWLAGNLKDEELKNLVNSEDFEAYSKLKFALDNLRLDERNTTDSFQKIQEKIAFSSQKSAKTTVISLYKWVSIAAIMVILVGLYNLLVFSNEIESPKNSYTSIVLQDHSKVRLNSNSSIEYPNLFSLRRILRLKGEAFFEVEKGSTFEVKTTMGSVTVLGTKFNVCVRKEFFEVDCYEGKVKVTSSQGIQILNKGEKLTLSPQHDGKVELFSEETSPSWLKGETSFNQDSLKNVLEKFELQFGVKVNYPKHLQSKIISGSFSNRDKRLALQSICYPLELKFIFITPTSVKITE